MLLFGYNKVIGMRRKLVMLPGPTNVPDRVTQAMLGQVLNHRSPAFRKVLRSVSEKTKQVFQTSNDIITLTASGSGGVEASIINIIRPGDKVLVTSFGEFGHRVVEQVVAAGGNPLIVDATSGDAPSIDQIKEVANKNKDIKSIIAVYNETSTGVTLRNLREIGKIASDIGAFYIVDAISILGGDELPVDELGVDICIAGSQKCLAAPPGLVSLSISNRVKEFLQKNPPPSRHYFNFPRYFKYAEKGETPFTPAIPIFYALDEALTIVLEEGLSNRIKRHKICADAFYNAFKAIGLNAIAKEEVRSNVVIAFSYPQGIDDRTFRETLDERFDIIIAGGMGDLKGKVFRIGCMGEIRQQSVLSTILSTSMLLNEMGYHNKTEKALEEAIIKLKQLN